MTKTAHQQCDRLTVKHKEQLSSYALANCYKYMLFIVSARLPAFFHSVRQVCICTFNGTYLYTTKGREWVIRCDPVSVQGLMNGRQKATLIVAEWLHWLWVPLEFIHFYLCHLCWWSRHAQENSVLLSCTPSNKLCAVWWKLQAKSSNQETEAEKKLCIAVGPLSF